MSKKNIIQEITDASCILFKKSMKSYNLNDLLIHKSHRDKNLYELCFQYPSKGILKIDILHKYFSF